MSADSVRLRAVAEGALFRIAGDRPSREPKVFQVIGHSPSSSLVCEVRHAEQIEFTMTDGTGVALKAKTRHPERWAGGTLVVPVAG